MRPGRRTGAPSGPSRRRTHCSAYRMAIACAILFRLSSCGAASSQRHGDSRPTQPLFPLHHETTYQRIQTHFNDRSSECQGGQPCQSNHRPTHHNSSFANASNLLLRLPRTDLPAMDAKQLSSRCANASNLLLRLPLTDLPTMDAKQLSSRCANASNLLLRLPQRGNHLKVTFRPHLSAQSAAPL